jgi:hypothetical protein
MEFSHHATHKGVKKRRIPVRRLKQSINHGSVAELKGFCGGDRLNNFLTT